jgi:hypothetical protein
MSTITTTRSSIQAMKYHKMTNKAGSMMIAFYQRTFWNTMPRIFLGISTLEDETNTLSRTAASTYAVTWHHIPEKRYPQLYHCENVYTRLLYPSLQTYCFILKAQVRYTHSLIHSFLGYFFTILQPHKCFNHNWMSRWWVSKNLKKQPCPSECIT